MARAGHAPERREGPAAIVARVAAALVGNYALTLGVASLAAASLALAGMVRSEAATLASMLAFLFYLIVLIAAFHTRRLARLWALIAAGAVASHGLAQLMVGGWG